MFTWVKKKKSEARNGKLDLPQTLYLKSAVSEVLKAFRLTHDVGKLLCPTADVLRRLWVKYVGFQSVAHWIWRDNWKVSNYKVQRDHSCCRRKERKMGRGWRWDLDAPVREHWVRINQSKTPGNWNKHWFSFPLSNSLRMVPPKSQEVSMQ